MLVEPFMETKLWIQKKTKKPPQKNQNHRKVVGGAFHWQQKCERQAMQLSHHGMKGISIISSTWTGELQPEYCVQSWISTPIHWTQWRQHRISQSLCQVGPTNLHIGICMFVRTYWTNMRLKVTVSSMALLPVTRIGVNSMSWSQNGNPWVATREFLIEENIQESVLSWER